MTNIKLLIEWMIGYEHYILIYRYLIRRQHQQKTIPAQVQPPLSLPVIPHQAPPTTPELSLTCSEERTKVSLGSNNKLSNTSKTEKSTYHYVEVEVSTTHPRAPPTTRAPPTNDIPTQYADICGHLNTVVLRY